MEINIQKYIDMLIKVQLEMEEEMEEEKEINIQKHIDMMKKVQLEMSEKFEALISEIKSECKISTNELYDEIDERSKRQMRKKTL